MVLTFTGTSLFLLSKIDLFLKITHCTKSCTISSMKCLPSSPRHIGIHRKKLQVAATSRADATLKNAAVNLYVVAVYRMILKEELRQTRQKSLCIVLAKK
jgi:hypothetical protein